jgi:predicted permease
MRLTAILTLALGIGASTVMFSVVKGVLLSPVAHADAQRVVSVTNFWRNTGRAATNVSGPDWKDIAALTDVFESVGRYHGGEIGVQLQNRAEFAGLYLVTPSFFPVFDVTPLRGRLPGERDANRSVLVGESFARRQFGSADAALGKTLTFDNNVLEIVGVMPETFVFPARAEVWPVVQTKPENEQRSAHNYRVVARLRPGVTVTGAQSRLDALAAQLEAAYGATNENKAFQVLPLAEQIVGNARSTILLLFGATGLLLLIACANVAHLLLARAMQQTREYAIRAAIGAGQGRLLRDALKSGLAVGIPGGAVGLVLAMGLLRLLVWLNPGNIPRVEDVRLDPAVLGAGIALALLCSVVFAMAPAWHLLRLDAQSVLRQGVGARGVLGGSARLRNGLVVAEVALSCALAIGAGLLFRSFLQLNDVSLGFRPEGVLVTYAHIPANTIEEMVAASRQFDQIVGQVRAMPGVVSAAAAMGVPAGRYKSNGLYFLEGGSENSRRAPSAGFRLAGPGYFTTLGIPLLAGRDFTERDQYDSTPVAIVSQALVRRSFPAGENPIGRRIQCGLDRPDWMTIVGVVGDTRTDSRATAPGPELYMPYPQHPWRANELQVTVRTTGEPASVQNAVEQIVRARNPRVAVKTTTMTAMQSSAMATPRFRTFLLGSFAVLAALLAMTGVYGLISWQVARRTSEVGMRMAVGASPGDIVRMVLRWSLVLTGIGLACGIGIAAVGTRVVESMLFGVAPADPVTWAAAVGGMLLAALIAAALPAWRAARIDPAVALRQD